MYYIYTIIEDKIYVIGEDKLTEVIIENKQLVATENIIAIPENFDNLYTYNELAYKFGLNENESGEIIGGTDNYLDLRNKPKINGIELTGNKTSEQLNISVEGLPNGGIVGQVLAKASETDFDTFWKTLENSGSVEEVPDNTNIKNLNNGLYIIKHKTNLSYQTSQGGTVGFSVLSAIVFVGESSTMIGATRLKQVTIYESDTISYYRLKTNGALDGMKEFDISNMITKNNTTNYTVSGDYNPAHKKYVDDTISNTLSNLNISGSSVTFLSKDEIKLGWELKSGLYFADTTYIAYSSETYMYFNGLIVVHKQSDGTSCYTNIDPDNKQICYGNFKETMGTFEKISLFDIANVLNQTN